MRSSRVTVTAALAFAASKSTSMARRRERDCRPNARAPAARRARAPPACRATAGSGSKSTLDLGGQILGLGARRRDAHGDELADIAHLAGGQHRLHGRLEAGKRRIGADGRTPVQVLGDEHAIADAGGIWIAWMRACASGLRRNATSCMPGSLMSPTKLAAAAHVAVVFLAQQPRADALLRHQWKPHPPVKWFYI